MKLIIKEYLSLLKESKELDVLVPDLLLSMGIEVISYPQSGLRQYGVDVLAFDSNKQELLVFTVKQGDINRSDWDSSEQSVRQSLNDIKDVYLNTHIDSRYSSVNKKIIVCTGGELKQSVQQNWSGYIKQNPISNTEYEFWGGDKLALLVEKHMLNEHIFPTALQSLFRRTLVLLPDSDYDLSDFYKLLDMLILSEDFGNLSKDKNLRKAIKSIKIINLSLSIIYHWSIKQNNIKPLVYVAEKVVLTLWEFIRKNDLYNNKNIIKIFTQNYQNLLSNYSDYFIKIEKHLHVKNGLNGYGQNTLLENINIFEQLGIISTAGLMHYFHVFNSDDIKSQQASVKSAKVLKDSVKALITNHLSTNSPCYDNHIVEITQTILLLYYCDELDFIDKWIKEIITHVSFAYEMGRNFPIESDSFDDLIALNISGETEKEELMQTSTLLPILAQLSSIFDLEKSYSLIKLNVDKYFSKTNLQIWYPNKDTDGFIYNNNAAYESGFMEVPISIPKNIEEMKNMINKIQEKTVKNEEISSIDKGLFILPIIASRHYRTPILPVYWQSILTIHNQ
ncbi:hypothetical protein [Bathymodiolus thermophilus thioautotrophic gill symbiont]|uniref:Chemotaxis protein n=1 Tax=Bathymodiolus thermophilus thioautotrophic gill symbiont TaxID=2360 RepID=A0A8H8XEA1_9GAMM|nr:hypothetical protein [Bathymodiolus thermophilus thioautotrophic gill symbiont]CAB5498354.1 hypothetical protein THERMOS_831 [Bathymodiolus thermophilus thioautotrophic gill symbiont]